MSESQPEYLTVSQAAARLGISERTVRRRCENGKIAARLVVADTGKSWQIEADSCGQRADTAANGADTPQSENRSREYSQSAANVSEAADGAAIPADTLRTLGRLEGYAARDLETTIAQAVSLAVEKAVAPLADEIRELRALIEKQSREDAPQGARISSTNQTINGENQSARRGENARRLTGWRRVVVRVLGIRQ